MILSYNTTKNANHSSSDDSIEEEEYYKIEDLMRKSKQENPEQEKREWEENVSLGNSSQISKIELCDQSSQILSENYQSKSSSNFLSHGEDCIQKDVMLIIEEDSLKKAKDSPDKKASSVVSGIAELKKPNIEEKVIDLSREKSFLSQKSKNFILKSDLVNLSNAHSSKSNVGCGLNESDRKESNNQINTSNILTNEPIAFNQNPQPGFGKIGANNNLGNLSSNMSIPNYFCYQNPNINQSNPNNQNNPNNNKNLSQGNSPKGFFPVRGNSSPSQNSTSLSSFNNQKLQGFGYSIQEVITNCYYLSKEQFGCRLLQKLLDENPSLASEVFYPSIKDKFIELSCELFGNYFIQKIIDYINETDLTEVLQRLIPPSFRNMCFNQHGTRVIQKVLQKIKDKKPLIDFFIILFKPYLPEFIYDQNASHIVSNFVICSNAPENDFVIEFLHNHIVDVAIQKHSCCALQKCIQFSNNIQSNYLLITIAQNSSRLFNNQYGNYVIQYVISLCNFEINHYIILNLLTNFGAYANMKYSSSIIEKCMQFSNKESINLILEKMCNDYGMVKKMLFDMYGNYVLQRALTIAREPYKSRLLEYIGRNMEQLMYVSYGSKLYNKLISNYPEIMRYMNSSGTGTGMNPMAVQMGNMNNGGINTIGMKANVNSNGFNMFHMSNKNNQGMFNGFNQFCNYSNQG